MILSNDPPLTSPSTTPCITNSHKKAASITLPLTSSPTATQPAPPSVLLSPSPSPPRSSWKLSKNATTGTVTLSSVLRKQAKYSGSSAWSGRQKKQQPHSSLALTVESAQSFLSPQPAHGGRRSSLAFHPIPDVKLNVAKHAAGSHHRHHHQQQRQRRASITFQDIPDVQIFHETECTNKIVSGQTSRISSNGKTTRKKNPKATVSSPATIASSSSSSSALAMHSAAWAPYFDDQVLASRKVYITRLYRAAVTIQRLARGYYQRKEFAKRWTKHQVELKWQTLVTQQHAAARVIQGLARQWLQHWYQHRCHAATRIQALGRGHYGRLIARMRRLERQLALIERQKARDLASIECWKRQQLADIRKEVDAVKETVCRLRAQARLAMDMVAELQAQHEALRAEHDQLTVDRQDVMQANQNLSQNAMVYQQGQAMVRDALKQVHRDHLMWQEIHDMYEERVREYVLVVEEREVLGMVERSIKRRYESTLKAIKRQLELYMHPASTSHTDGDFYDSEDDDYYEDFSGHVEDFVNDVEETYKYLMSRGLFDKLQSSSCPSLHDSSLVELGSRQWLCARSAPLLPRRSGWPHSYLVRQEE